MTKTLIKKQLMETFSFFWQDKKKNKFRTGGKLVLSVVLYLALFSMIALMFLYLALTLCAPLVAAGLDWLYFALMGLIGVALGAFGSVFNTYASLYQAKDNNMLLAMPIDPSKLLLVRLTGVYAMGLMYELLVMIPVVGVYCAVAAPGILTVILSILVVLVLSVFVLVLSTVLGYVVALISAKTKNKSLITVVLSLAFIAAYYYAYSRAYGMLQSILSAPEATGDIIRSSIYPLYQMGLAASGNPGAFAIFTAMILALFALVYLVLAGSYLRIVTSNKGQTKKAYKQQPMKSGSVDSALFRKELRRFLGSPNYILNCGLGIFLMIIAAVALLIKGPAVREMVVGVFGQEEDIIPLLACAAICLMACMNDISAPSVSLEGKNIWLVQVLPVSSWQVLAAKLMLHLVCTLIPVLLLSGSAILVLRPAWSFVLLIPLVAVLFVLFMGSLGLTINLLTPNLNWTNEIIPIKQSLGVMITLLGGWAIVFALCALYYLLIRILSPTAYLVCVGAVLLLASAGLLLWLKTRGTRIFEAL